MHRITEERMKELFANQPECDVLIKKIDKDLKRIFKNMGELKDLRPNPFTLKQRGDHILCSIIFWAEDFYRLKISSELSEEINKLLRKIAEPY